MIPLRVEIELAQGTLAKIIAAFRDWRDTRTYITAATHWRKCQVSACSICGITGALAAYRGEKEPR